MMSNIDFFKTCALFIRGEVNTVKMKGNRSHLALISSALQESKKLYDLLESESDEKSVMSQLKRKNLAARQLRVDTGLAWPF